MDKATAGSAGLKIGSSAPRGHFVHYNLYFRHYRALQALQYRKPPLQHEFPNSFLFDEGAIRVRMTWQTPEKVRACFVKRNFGCKGGKIGLFSRKFSLNSSLFCLEFAKKQPRFPAFSRRNLLTKQALKRLLPVSALILCVFQIMTNSVRAGTTLKEVEVYWPETLQQEPMPTTGFDAHDVRAAEIEDTRDFIELTPNVTLDDEGVLGSTFLTIRGITRGDDADSPTATDIPIAIIIDGVPQNHHRLFRQKLFDVSRIEISKGAQGVRGRNAMGGAIHITTKDPTHEPEGYLEAGIFQNKGRTVRGAMGGPIIDNVLLYRLAGTYEEGDGRIDNGFLGRKVDFRDDENLRAKLRFLPTDVLSLDFVYNTYRSEKGAFYDSVFTDSESRNSDTFLEPTSNVPGHSRRRGNDFTLKMAADFEIGMLTLRRTRTDMDETSFGDGDFLPDASITYEGTTHDLDYTNAQNTEVKTIAHELGWSSNEENRFHWTAGWFREKTRWKATDSQAKGEELVSDSDSKSEDRHQALFAEIDYDVTERLKSSGSLRHDRYDRKQLPSGDRAYSSARKARLALSYQFTDNNLLYASYGVSSQQPGRTVQKTYEVGSKNSFFGQRLTLNGSGYLSRAFGSTDVMTKGFEWNTTVRLLDGWELFGGMGLTSNTTADTLRTYNLGASYRFSIGSTKGDFRLDVVPREKTYWNKEDGEYQEPITLCNAKLTLTRGNFQLAFWGKNLLDEAYYDSFNDDRSWGTGTGLLGQPRTIGMDARYDF
uniref:Iron complex outermembrane recepter protein n=1 Tax=Candidatus Kentrum sp. DK TaxID=2126562 RepID=A0A450SWX9_9GAMM|nr:MAG: iron complex outermembrane recepter protein [Candidatus Kentron sp. DK]